MWETIGTRLYNYVLAAPVNLVIIIVVCLLLKIFGKIKFIDMIKIVIAYFLVCFLLSLFGICMPSFITVANWIVNLASTIWHKISGIFH